jgi:hypothetical protein
VDQELKAYLDEREARMSERFKQVETEARHTRILVEGLHSNMRLLAEGVVGTNERIDSLRAETTGKLDEIKGNVVAIQQILVPRVEGLENRVQVLEGRAERETRDIIEVVRERFGPRQAP